MPLLIYSVPTKEILKRVGSDCEAHGINYWTAGKIGTDYFIRRPYSIRNCKENAGQLRGDMYYQLLLTIAQSIRFEDKIPGRCEVILADIEATAKILEVISQPDDVLNAIKLTSFGNPSEELKPCHKLILDGLNNPESRHKHTSWLRPENIILFFDEPNMGIHISPDVESIVKRITSHYPHIAILASATMKNWEALPEWWHGSSPSTRPKYHTISSMAYSLPVAELGLITDNYKKSHAISAFDLFNNHSDFISYMKQINDISMGQLLRHFTEKHITAINIASAEQAKKAFASPDTLQDFRQSILKQYLNTIDEPGFNSTRDTWSNYKGTEISSLKDNISTTGITLIATHHPHKIAYLLTQMKDEDEWNEEIHNVRRITKRAKTMQKEREREFEKAEKLKKKRQKDEDDDGEPDHTPVKCKFGRLELYVDELDDLSEQSLVFLSKGIAISSPDADPGIKLQFQRAIYSRPEALTILPDIHILVVDYASIYGLDCPGVDKIILCDDLGDLLNQDDIIQFIGRLRRKGNAMFMNFKNMAKILGMNYNPNEPIELLNQDIITGLQTLTNKEQALPYFKTLCKRIYNGKTFSQQEIFESILRSIICNFPETEIKAKLQLIIEITESIELTNMAPFLESITDVISSYSLQTLKQLFAYLYNNVNDTEDHYNAWYVNLQTKYDELMRKMVPIMDWINGDE
jgi:hypothetical protein